MYLKMNTMYIVRKLLHNFFIVITNSGVIKIVLTLKLIIPEEQSIKKILLKMIFIIRLIVKSKILYSFIFKTN